MKEVVADGIDDTIGLGVKYDDRVKDNNFVDGLEVLNKSTSLSL